MKIEWVHPLLSFVPFKTVKRLQNGSKNIIFKNWFDTRLKMETHEPNVYPSILGGVFAKSARFQVLQAFRCCVILAFWCCVILSCLVFASSLIGLRLPPRRPFRLIYETFHPYFCQECRNTN